MNSYRNLFGHRTSITLAALLVAGGIPVTAGNAAIAADMSSMVGSIRGRVMSNSGRAISGAEVVIKPGNTTAMTDRDGFYVARELSAGTYTVEVNYMGLDKFTQTVQVETGKSAILNVKLHETSGITVEIVESRVTGEEESLNQTKNSMDIVNILPAEVITSLPNANVADAIGRLPSVSLERDEGEGKYIQVRGLESRYTSVSINGTRIPSSEAGVRQIKLDAFPSDLLGTIELHKTVSADIEGDAIGGSVNMVTKNAPDGGMRVFGIETGYDAQSGGRFSSQINGTWAQRFLPNNNLGVVFGATYDRNGRSINDMEPTPGVSTLAGGSQVTAFNAVDLRDYQYDRKRYGAAGGLDYRLDDNSLIYLKAFYSKFKNFGDRWVTSISAGSFITPTTTDATGGYSGNVQNRRPIEETYSFTAGGKHDLGGFILDYSAAYSHASQDRIGQMQANYADPQNVAFTVDSSNGHFPQFMPIGAVNYTDPSQWVVNKFMISNEQTAARSTSFEANVLFPYSSGLLKVGLKYRDEDKTSFYGDRSYNPTGSNMFTLDQGLATFSDPHFYMNHYKLGPLGGLYAIENFFNANPSAFTQNISNDRINNDPNNWDAKEKVTAVYVKNTSQLTSAQLEYGVRFEHTSTHFNASLITTDAAGNWLSTQPTEGSHDYSNVLPSLSWRYEFDKDNILRAVYGWAIGRPNYGQLVPSLTATDITVPIKRVFAGNPDLKPTKAVNYDLLFERYLPSFGVLSAGVFYKDLSDPIYGGASTILVGGPYNGYQETRPINGPKANLYGYEVAWKQHLSFLPGALGGLGVDTNYTHTTSKATFDASTGRTGTAALQRTAPDLANFGLTYDWSGFSFRIAASYNSAMIFAYNYQDGAAGGLNGPNGDTYLSPHTQIDAEASYTFKDGLKIVLSALNINNEVFGFYSGSPQWSIQREFYNRTFTVGLKKNW